MMYVCRECGCESSKWMGKCPDCNSWNSFTETTRITGKKKNGKKTIGSIDEIKMVTLKDIDFSLINRIKTGIGEFDTVLGGGIVPGMVTLIGGEPGIGKSTLLLQISDVLSRNKHKTCYISGEESKEQIKMRAMRLNIPGDNLLLLCANDLDEILQQVKESKPDFLVIDSIQSVFISANESVPGSVSQLRECTAILTTFAKMTNTPVFIIGHVTKDGVVAGPKIIEHQVDTVLYFERDTNGHYKILRAIKNRFGSTNEIGIFEMLHEGLKEVANPSELFLNSSDLSPGSAIGSVIEGTRAFLVEVQALVSDASFGTSQRVVVGLAHKRLAIMLAIIDKSLDIQLKQSDVFINIAGGISSDDTSLDLATIASIISSYTNRKVADNTIFMGEVGLNGEIRAISYPEKRIKEAIKLGYQNIVLSGQTKYTAKKGNLFHIRELKELMKVLF